MATAAQQMSPRVKVLKARRATPEALAPYGQVLGPNPSVAPMPIDFYGGAVKVRRVVDFKSDDQTEMPLITLNRRPLEVRWMERHFKHTQAFIPLGGVPFIGVFAPPNDKELPDIEKCEAFVFDGSAGFAMHFGTWHEFPFALRDDTNLIVILRKEATDGLVRDAVVQDEAQSADLDKKDLLTRLNTVMKIEY
jgi:ureidoglycolate lyase